jgi:hypothetical protein
MGKVLEAFGLLHFTMLQPVHALRAFWKLWTVYFFNFSIFGGFAVKRGWLKSRIMNQWIWDMTIYIYINRFSGKVDRDSSVGSDWLWGGRSGDRIPVGGDIFRTPPDRPWGPTRVLYNVYQVSFSVVKRPGCGADQPPHLVARLKKE